MTDVAYEHYDAVTYVKPEGEVHFKAAFSNGYPTQHKPDVVIVSTPFGSTFPGTFMNSDFKTQIVPVLGGGSDLTVYEESEFVDRFRQRTELFQQKWAEWLSIIRYNDYYNVGGSMLRLKSISMVAVEPVDGFSSPVYVLLNFEKGVLREI